MSILIQVSDLHKNYGMNVVLEGACAAFAEGQKIAVIGRNGAGKSTLCRILTGHEEPDGGTVARSAELRLSYLEQQDPFALDETVLAFLTRHSGREEWQCGKVAGRFQLKNVTLDTPIGELSGGIRTRIKLTAMLLKEPNFLILDEPTNYLDLKTLLLLEKFLQGCSMGFLIVSHDREFLKKTCEETLEVERGGLTLYPGDVEAYLEFKAEQRQQNLNFNRNVEAKQRQLQDFVDRFRAKATKAAQAKSKMKQIARMKTIEIGHPLDNVRIRIPNVETRNSVALRCDDLAVGYPGKRVAEGIRMEIDQGAHVAVVGENGQGKTTFLRTLAGELPPLSGAFKWGHALRVAYYAQHVYVSLEAGSSVLDHLTRVAADSVTRQEILDLAGSFLFKGQDVEKKIRVLSGGERARLCLAGLLLTRSQVLLLDEPNNHLDFETVEALGRALREFRGTVFFISHDRTFVNLLATQIIEVHGGAVRLYPERYEEYVARLEQALAREEDEGGSGAKRGAKGEGHAAAVPEGELDARRRKELESEKKNLASQIKKAADRIATHKKERDVIHDDFMKNPTAWSRERNRRYEELARLIKAGEDQWLELSEKLELLDGH